jgi:hypothetical protein
MALPRSLTTLLVVLTFALVAGPALAEPEAPEEPEDIEAEEADVLRYEVYEELLQKYVDDRGRVDYAAWHASRLDSSLLNAFVGAIGTADPTGKSRDAQLAFYLNAYNALVIHDVLRRWPMTTVMDEEDFFDGRKHQVAGRSMTLDELEHTEVIRPRFQEPRIHFVLVCAAIDCPRLRTTALTAANLEAELQAATREYIPSVTRQTGDSTVETSKLFKWFAEDFEAHSGTVAAYLARYVTGDLRALLGQDGTTIEFAEYDWALNGR